MPQANTVPELVAQAGTSAAASATSGASAGTGTAGQAGNDAAGTAALPPLITAVGSEAAPASTATADAGSSTPAAPAATALDRLLAPGQVALSSVVLGPTNTAVFRTPQGFVVVEQGQTVPGLSGEDGTPVVLQTVEPGAVTVALGNTVKSLELEQR